jgi:hypothetical protein
MMEKLHSEVDYNLYFSSIIVRVITSRKIRWVGHIASTWGENEK